MSMESQRHQFIARHPQPGDNPVDRLRHTLAVHGEQNGLDRERVVITATTSMYAPGLVTGLTLGDLEDLLAQVEAAPRPAQDEEPGDYITVNASHKLNREDLIVVLAKAVAHHDATMVELDRAGIYDLAADVLAHPEASDDTLIWPSTAEWAEFTEWARVQVDKFWPAA